ncbi:MAG: hypothetical protein L3J79_11680, partial [Candidatus Marinimicrobia bacterium]|nr:hypothetical protein [Candidatus Neomarinimicrobiota bacterium]
SETSLDFVLWAENKLTNGVQGVEVNVLRDDCLNSVGKSTERTLESSRNLFSTWMRKYVENALGGAIKRKKSSGKSLISIVCPEGEGGAEVQASAPSKPSGKRPLGRKKPTTKSLTPDDVFDE